MKSRNRKTTFYFLIFVFVLLLGFSWFYREKITNRFLDEDEKNLRSHYKGIDCNKLTGRTVRPGNDMVELKKSVCAAERAWFENNPDFCELHSNPDQCYGWMAIKTGDLSLCEFKTEKTGYFHITNQLKENEKDNAWLYDCYRATANWRNDPDVCDSIPYKDDSSLQSCKNTTSNWGDDYSRYNDTSPI